MEDLAHELTDLFEKDLEKFIELHDENNLNFIRNNNKLRRDYKELRRNFTPDMRLHFLLDLQKHIKIINENSKESYNTRESEAKFLNRLLDELEKHPDTDKNISDMIINRNHEIYRWG